MKLEGKIVGPWVAELRRAWTELRSSHATKKLALDLCAVTSVDESGLALLQEMHHATPAEFIANSPLTKHFADRAAKSNR